MATLPGRRFKVLELFSGIGGMRCGLIEGAPANVHFEFTSIDMNEFCNSVYADSFGEKPICKNICTIPISWFEKLGADIWTMSPPCQPYTRQGNQLESEDNRSNAFHYLVEKVLAELKNLPEIIFLENVKNFETSDSFKVLVEVLGRRGYDMTGYLLNPLYMGFPNSRLRFFFVARRKQQLHVPIRDVEIFTNDPQCPEYQTIRTGLENHQYTIGDFLCPNHLDDSLLILERVLEKKSAFCFDIVSHKSTQCLCFTRAYTKFIDGTGSVLYEPGDDQKDVCEWDEKNRPKFSVESMTRLYGKLRYFCPIEAARLNGFNVNDEIKKLSLNFVGGCSCGKKYYRAVGNSLNPHVVAFLVRQYIS